MAELLFPSVDGKPNGYEEKLANGVTYIWNSEFDSWMIGSSQQVNKDYVDSRDQLRLRVDGLNHMYGDIVFREEADSMSDITVELRQNGTLILNGNKNIQFVGDGGNISIGRTEFLRFSNSMNMVQKPFKYDDNLSTLQTTSGRNDVVLFNYDSTSSTQTRINFSRGSGSGFRIASGTTNNGLYIASDGSVSITSVSERAFTVDSGVLYVDGNAKKAYVSEDQNKHLVESVGSIYPPADNMIATKGYVDANSTNPGVAVVALSEEEAEVNGFWRNGNNLYLKVSE